MTKADKEEIKELIGNSLAGLHARTESKFDMIDLKLESILEQTTRHNNRMSKIEAKNILQDDKIIELEKKELNHIASCPNVDKIRVLEDNQLTQKSIKKWIVGSVGIATGMISVMWMIMQLIGG